ncbi:hypothetical protein KVR01_001773 [Diaporthe batatas]|uniref:uncharacterized protein n=1 Tax=Diaporthe batatas TaxID=748121 RepID=UPI001D043A66|nr:uncharacterized protein KVR01_001773 [Diaporthe batatas]KAG8169024.1 hypothetical protein KVR01_001773 [Diaporthe batatas]
MSTFFHGTYLHGAPAPVSCSTVLPHFRPLGIHRPTATRSGTFTAVLDPLKFSHQLASIVNIVIHGTQGIERVSAPEHPPFCYHQHSSSDLYHER